MQSRVRKWLNNLPYPDGFEREQALLVQRITLIVAFTMLFFSPFAFLMNVEPSGQVAIVSLVGIISIFAFVAWSQVRFGRHQIAVLILALSWVALISLILYGVTVEKGTFLIGAFMLPIAMSGLLGGRRILIISFVVTLSSLILVMVLDYSGAPGSGFAAVRELQPVVSVTIFSVLAGLLAFFIDGTTRISREALEMRQASESELRELSQQLELTVEKRTADLNRALEDVQRRSAAQAKLLEENTHYQETIRELSVPVLPIDAGTVVVPLVGSLDTGRLESVQQRALSAVEELRVQRLLLDITGVAVVDTQVAQGLLKTLQAVRLLGADVVLVGVRPEVAQAIVGLGLDLSQMRSYADLQSALK